MPETHDPTATGWVDVLGAALSSVGLSGSPSRSSLPPDQGAFAPTVLISGGLGIPAIAGFFVAWLRSLRLPMSSEDRLLVAARRFNLTPVETLEEFLRRVQFGRTRRVDNRPHPQPGISRSAYEF